MANKNARLVYEETGIEVKVGDEVTTHDGEKVTVDCFAPPHKASSQGKVNVTFCKDKSWSQEFYVGVIGAKWINRDDRD